MQLSGPYRKWLWPALGVTLLCGIVLGLLFRPSKPVPFTVLHQPVKRPVSLRDYFDRWIPSTKTWAWAWRVEQTVFGKRKPVNISAQVVEVPKQLSNLVSAPPSFAATNGLQAWLLNSDSCKQLREHFKESPVVAVLFQPRIRAADGIEARLVQASSIMLNGTNKAVGLSFNCFARVRHDFTDLTMCLTYSEPKTNATSRAGSSADPNLVWVQTNFDLAVRLQLPKGSGFFLLDKANPGRSGNRFGLLVDPP